MDRKDIIRMAREAGLDPDLWNYTDAFERFAAFVAADEREKVARWHIGSGYTTGHGDTIEDLLVELEWQVRESERDACAKVCEELKPFGPTLDIQKAPAEDCAAAIRARRNT